METFYILDTCSLYSYCIEYYNLFNDRRLNLEKNSLNELHSAFLSRSVKIVIPSVVFIEIFDHNFYNREIINKFKYNFYRPIISDEYSNVYISGIDQEILDNLPATYAQDISIDLHDRIILATALKYSDKNTILFTSDDKIKKIRSKNSLKIKLKK